MADVNQVLAMEDKVAVDQAAVQATRAVWVQVLATDERAAATRWVWVLALAMAAMVGGGLRWVAAAYRVEHEATRVGQVLGQARAA